MATVGIIAEFNPLHSGHEYLISEAGKCGNVICVISSNFVQRGDTALVSKQIRAKAALLAGADLVAELPAVYSMSTAQSFALAGISSLAALGCDTVIFGSEAGCTEPLLKIADILLSSEFSSLSGKYLSEGISFAAARQRACEELGGEKEILDKPNNNLGIEYIVAAKKLGLNLNFKTVKRLGTRHDSDLAGEYASASLLRKKLLSGEREFCRRYIKKEILDLMDDGSLSDINRIETAILAVLRTKSLDELEALPDMSEGLHNRLFSAIGLATSLDGLYNEIKVKRYPLARIRRLVLSAFLGFDNRFFMKPVPYVRVLGLNETGKQLLKNAAVCNSSVPIVTRVSDIKDTELFKTEAKATDLFNLSLKTKRPCGDEYTFKLILKE